ncbi:MAG: sulfotransferase, partial [Chloroflexota bacterium]|nr:sulfotransferase [Chloroflexota bacterium]
RLTPKRFFILLFIFLVHPIWNFSIHFAYGLDNLFFPDHRKQDIKQPIFIVGNFRSGTTLLHRMLAKDERTTGMKSWEIYIAPSITQRKIIHAIMKVNRLIGRPIDKLLNAFDKALREYSYMHPTGLREIEEDGQIFLHLWSSYNLYAFFPFPELIHNYIYYDEEVPENQRRMDMSYYQEVLKRHVYVNGGKRYISKSPTFSAKVRSLHEQFPDAKFINLVRSPKNVIPSTISLYTNHWRTYGDPEEEYPLLESEVLLEQARHWYIHPHQYLKRLPEDQYIMVHYTDLVADPEATIKQIYRQFGMEMTADYAQVVHEESERAKQYKSNHHYSLQEMGLTGKRIDKEVRLPVARQHIPLK